MKYKMATLKPDAHGIYETEPGWHVWEILDRFFVDDNKLVFKVMLTEDPDFWKTSLPVSPAETEKPGQFRTAASDPFDACLIKEPAKKTRRKAGDQ